MLNSDSNWLIMAGFNLWLMRVTKTVLPSQFPGPWLIVVRITQDNTRESTFRYISPKGTLNCNCKRICFRDSTSACGAMMIRVGRELVLNPMDSISCWLPRWKHWSFAARAGRQIGLSWLLAWLHGFVGNHFEHLVAQLDLLLRHHFLMSICSINKLI